MSEAGRCCKEPEEESWELHDDKRIAAGKSMPARSQFKEATAHELHLVNPSQNNVMRDFEAFPPMLCNGTDQVYFQVLFIYSFLTHTVYP